MSHLSSIFKWDLWRSTTVLSQWKILWNTLHQIIGLKAKGKAIAICHYHQRMNVIWKQVRDTMGYSIWNPHTPCGKKGLNVKFQLKAYTLMSNRGRSQNFKNLNFLHIFLALLKEAHFPKGIRLKSFQYEMRAIFTESLICKTLFNAVVYGSTETHIIMQNLKT